MFDTSLNFEQGNLWAATAFGVFVYLAGHAVHFGSVQRYVSMPNQTAAGRALVVNGLMVGIVCGVFFLAGSTLFAFYQQQSALPVAPIDRPTGDSATATVAADTLYDQLQREKHQDHLLPRFVMTELAVPGLLGLLLAGLFAAAMSSIDSGINSMTASVVCDWQSERQLELRHSRMLCCVFGLLSVTVAIVFYFQGGNVFPMIMKIAGMFFGLQLGIFVLGMSVKRATTRSAMIGLAAGIIGLIMTFVFEISHWWYGAITCVPTYLVGVAASCLNSPDGNSIGQTESTPCS
jgi:Na+/proline symporter